MVWLINLLARLFGWDSVKEEVEYTPPKQPDIPIQTNAEKLYHTSFLSIGQDMSPLDKAPDSLGCAESLNGVFKATFGEVIGEGAALVSTHALYLKMKKDPRFEGVMVPRPGDIVISPTGFSEKGSPTGHCGIWGKHNVMSNDSNSGLWTANYTHEGWYTVFKKKLGFPVFFFRVLG